MGLTRLDMTHIRTVSPLELSGTGSSAVDEPSSPQRRMKRLETFSILGQVPVGEQGRLWGHSLKGSPQSLSGEATKLTWTRFINGAIETQKGDLIFL